MLPMQMPPPQAGSCLWKDVPLDISGSFLSKATRGGGQVFQDHAMKAKGHLPCNWGVLGISSMLTLLILYLSAHQQPFFAQFLSWPTLLFKASATILEGKVFLHPVVLQPCLFSCHCAISKDLPELSSLVAILLGVCSPHRLHSHLYSPLTNG